VADLAGDTSVVALNSNLRHITVTQGALLMAGVLHLTRRDRVNRKSPIVATLPERLRYQHAPRDQETGYGKEEDGGQAGDLLWHSVDYASRDS
jgi:hypothetical protein